MKIGASTLATFNDSLDESLEFIESLGIKYAELLHQYPTEEFDLDVLNSFNLDYTIHAPFMDVNIAALGSKSRTNSIEQIKDSVDLANQIDAKAVVVHPGLIPFLAREMPEEIYKVSNNYILTFLLYICHPMLFWDSNYILRQHLAISLSAIVIYYSNKKLISIPMAIVAASMHLSAIVIIPFLIWKELKLGKASVVKIVFMVGLALIILSVLFYQLVAQSDRYSGYLTAEHNLYLVPFLLLAPLVVILYMQRRFIYKNVHERNLFEYLLYGLVFTLFSMSSSFGRITTYFIAFVPVAVPIVLKYSYKKNMIIFMYVFFLFAIELYMLYLNCNGIFKGNLIQ